MAGNVLELTDDNFHSEVMESDVPVLVDFWAPWCAPCRALAPTIEALAEEFDGKVKVVKLNTEEAHQTAVAQRISGLPTLVVFNKGEAVDRLMGNQPKEKIAASLNAVTA